MEENKKILFLIGIIFLVSIVIPFWGIGYNENIVSFFTKHEDGVFYDVPTDLIYAIKYLSIYISINLGIVSQVLLVYLLRRKSHCK